MTTVETSIDQPRVRVSDVTHYFEDPAGNITEASKAVDDVSLDVAPGEFVSLIGPSGCGKTTLLNMLAGFFAPTTGSLQINGKPVRGVQSDNVSFMFARDTLFPWKTTLANVTFPMEVGAQRVPSSERRDRARRLLERVQLGGAEEKYPHELSHGMRQRAALARTLAGNKEVILMDEPFGALDAQTRVLVQDEFAKIWEQERPSVLMVTHDLTEAIGLSDRIFVMSHRPAHIKAVYEVNIPRPRVILDLPNYPEFHELYAKLWRDLRPELTEDETPAADHLEEASA
ncbi:ABC transporter ATP-binding protein [Microbacterium aoyamense]|uniref:ABC transporter ATP-binding protein n=1 Tax=Microbacterium aoyamense TaxID=344166 RepID=A0ABN2PTM6_9MICO|nr:ABC transporter ATP-binding protein [Microbacterium aoyamense]